MRITESSGVIEKVDNIFMENRVVFTCYLISMAKEMYDTHRKVYK